MKEFPLYFERLPSYEEVCKALYERELINLTPDNWTESWFSTCIRKALFQLWNKEYVEELSVEIKKLVNDKLVLEVAAGDGMLSHWLREYGVNIKATDDMSWHNFDRTEYPIKIRSEVEKLDAIEAIQKYKPNLVIASWIPYGSDLDYKILKEKVSYFIIIGEGPGGCTGSEVFWEKYEEEGYVWEYFKEVDKYNICRTDSAIQNIRIYKHSSTALFKRVCTANESKGERK